jgi:hypothetical protein
MRGVMSREEGRAINKRDRRNEYSCGSSGLDYRWIRSRVGWLCVHSVKPGRIEVGRRTRHSSDIHSTPYPSHTWSLRLLSPSLITHLSCVQPADLLSQTQH